jgi:DNA-binding MltR family transcriptional regulator
VPHGSWFENFLGNLISIALRFIPGIGPLIAVALDVVWAAIKDLNKPYDKLKENFPTLDFADHYLNAAKDIEKTANEAQSFIKASFLNATDQEMQAMLRRRRSQQ